MALSMTKELNFKISKFSSYSNDYLPEYVDNLTTVLSFIQLTKILGKSTRPIQRNRLLILLDFLIFYKTGFYKLFRFVLKIKIKKLCLTSRFATDNISSVEH